MSDAPLTREQAATDEQLMDLARECGVQAIGEPHCMIDFARRVESAARNADAGCRIALEQIIDIWDERNLPHEQRTYIEGALANAIESARAELTAPSAEPASVEQERERFEASYCKETGRADPPKRDGRAGTAGGSGRGRRALSGDAR